MDGGQQGSVAGMGEDGVMATVYRTDGQEETINTPPKHLSLGDAQRAIGGRVELVRLGSGRGLLVNEEGLLKRLPLNAKATEIAGQPIVGDAVLVVRGEGWL